MSRVSLMAMIASLTLGCFPWEVRAEREDAKLKALSGRNIHELISAWGAPSQSYPNGDTTIYEWRWEATTTRAFASSGILGTSATVSTAYCREWFDVDGNDLIIGWHWQGRC